MNGKRFALSAVLPLLLIALLAGCAGNAKSGFLSRAQQAPQPTPTTELAPLVPITATPAPSSELAPLIPITPTPTQKPTPTATAGNADWVLSVDDSVTLTVAGATYHVNLYVSMNKAGGKDATGVYTGKILYTSAMDEAELGRLLEEANPEETFDAGYLNYTIEAASASLEVVQFNEADCAARWGSVPAKADQMAIGTIDMVMRTQAWAHLHGYRSEGEGSASDEAYEMPADVCFLIAGGQVKAYIGIHPGDDAFSGTLN